MPFHGFVFVYVSINMNDNLIVLLNIVVIYEYKQGYSLNVANKINNNMCIPIMCGYHSR